MYKIITATAITCIALVTTQCTNSPTGIDASGPGTIDAIVWISKPTSQPTRETKWNKVIVQITAKDMEDIKDTFSVDVQNSLNTFSFEQVPAGKDRRVDAWTIDTADDTIHGVASYTTTVETGLTTKVPLTLNPLKGSLYLQLSNFPTTVDSIQFSFVTKTKSYTTKQKKASKVNCNLDKIPYGSIGTLSIIGVNAAKDTIASWSKQSFEFKNANTTLQVSFVNAGTISLDVSIVVPGVTTIIGSMNTSDSLSDEIGGLIISEIMYAADDSEYVEIYNPKDSVFNDTIHFQKDSDPVRAFLISVPAKGFYVIGRKDSIPWVDTFSSAKTALDLSSASGNWLTLRSKNSVVMDIVPFVAGSNGLGWPNVSGKKSIVLDSLTSDPEYNNYGKNWNAAKSLINSATTQQMGTPGTAGL